MQFALQDLGIPRIPTSAKSATQHYKMASKTISDRTTVAGLEDPNEKEDDALQQKVEEFASRYYERILKMKKPKQTTLGPDTVGFVIMNESTGGSKSMAWIVRTCQLCIESVNQ